ncbi:hypothetical protein NZK33_14860 [Cyanobium sp. FGCU-6]|jgi:hypothetical protein|nr:hypothetical protein [Cyanobium sp. FGCU6]
MGVVVGLLYGLIGSAYLVYGKRQGDTWFIFVGFTLLIFPYFITNALLAVLVGTALMLFPIARLNGWF